MWLCSPRESACQASGGSLCNLQRPSSLTSGKRSETGFPQICAADSSAGAARVDPHAGALSRLVKFPSAACLTDKTARGVRTGAAKKKAAGICGEQIHNGLFASCSTLVYRSVGVLFTVFSVHRLVALLAQPP
jgi:hypothetical protein